MTPISWSKYSCVTKTMQYLQNPGLLFCSWISIYNASPPCLCFTWVSTGCLSVVWAFISFLCSQFPLSPRERRWEHSNAMISLVITRNMQKNNFALPPPWKQSDYIFKNQGKNCPKADSCWNTIRPEYLKSQAFSNNGCCSQNSTQQLVHVSVGLVKLNGYLHFLCI